MNRAIYLLAILLLTIGTRGLAQKELHIRYNVFNGSVPKEWKIKSVLKANNKYVWSKESAKEVFTIKTGDNIIREHILNFNFKDLGSNTLWSEYDQQFIVREELNLFDWKFCQKTDTILNYWCRTAKANYMGRSYTAWFTTEIHFKAAPWKISGLPGVLLKLQSDDGFYSLTADSLSINESTSDIIMPFKENKAISWDKYLIEYKKKIDESEKQTKAMEIQFGRKYNMAYPKIEVIIDKNRGTVEELYRKLGLRK